jgi:hypothetical protein
MRNFLTCTLICTLLITTSAAWAANSFKAGFAKTEVTPPAATPMWGYGARHDLLSRGTRDPLYAKALVIEAGDQKLALVGLDLGRSPGSPDFDRIIDAVREKAGVTQIMMSGSHTHHGPVIELQDEEGKGKGKFDDAVAYRAELEQKLIDVIIEAAGNTQDARIGWSSKHVDMNRNRHSKVEPKPRDTELSVVRLDDTSGNPIAIMVNFSAHPTTLDGGDLRFSADYPGAMMNTVEAALDTNCFFMQGSAADLSIKTIPADSLPADDPAFDPKNLSSAETKFLMEQLEISKEDAVKRQINFIASAARADNFGKRLGQEVIALASSTETRKPASPSIQGQYVDFGFKSRVNFKSKFVQGMFRTAFFDELANSSIDDVADNIIKTRLTVTVLNKELALVGGSGEFFCEHATGLKARSTAVKTLFLGYCNGHNMYFPTIKAVSQGGYGADPEVSWVEIGAGEQMINEALIIIYEYLGKLTRVPLGGK